MELNNDRKIHFIGIKGAGMSSLAQILHDIDYKVKGSDVNHYFFTEEKLIKKNIKINEFNEDNIDSDDIVVSSRAFDKTNVEVKKAIKRNNFYYYFDFLSHFAESFPCSIAISGSHGKTTTTGIASHILSTLSKTSYLIGDGTGKGVKGSQHFIFEACEYKNHFHAYKPDYAIVTNIDFDHPDFFKEKKDVEKSFQTFAKKAKKGLIVYGDQEECSKLVSNARVKTYGFDPNNDLYAAGIETDIEGTSFDLYQNGKKIGKMKIPMHGSHQILNTLSVVSLLLMEGYAFEEFATSLSDYEGVNRRFKETQVGSNIVVDDYAHHPTEIKATIESVNLKYPEKKKVAIFQPHTYTRTKALLNEFAESLGYFDECFILDIFGSAREKIGSSEISSHDLVRVIGNKKAKHSEFDIPERVMELSDAVLLFLGAGNVNKLKEHYVSLKNDKEVKE